MTAILLLLALGLLVGFLSGLLGLGGGIIVVPTLVLIFPLIGITDSIHLAVGTSFATVLITLVISLSSRLQHHDVRHIFKLALKFVPGIVIGALLGSYLSKILPGKDMGIFFGIIVWLLALRVFLVKDSSAPNPKYEPGSLPGMAWLIPLSFGIGIISELIGVGGGIFLVSYLGTRGYSMKIAGTISPIVSIPMAVVGLLSYIVIGQGVSHLPLWSTGYVYWPAVLWICITSTVSAHFSAQLSHKMSSNSLRIIFIVVLTLIGFKMVFWP